METILKIANEDEIIPNELLFHDLHKVFSKVCYISLYIFQSFTNPRPEGLYKPYLSGAVGSVPNIDLAFS